MLGRNKNDLKLCTPARDKMICDKNVRAWSQRFSNKRNGIKPGKLKKIKIVGAVSNQL